MKIIVGAGHTFQSGWVSLKQSDLDLLDEAGWARLFAPASLDAILAEHVWEHLTYEQGLVAARNCFKYLKPGGYLRLAVPDGFHPSASYIDWVRPGNRWNGDDHKVLYNYKTLSDVLTAAGFGKVNLLEWFDESKRFNRRLFSQHDGNILRCSKHWYGTVLHSLLVDAPYTSIVVDAVKVSESERQLMKVDRAPVAPVMMLASLPSPCEIVFDMPNAVALAVALVGVVLMIGSNPQS